jgi:mitogen-activated protein kinase kinase
MTADLLDVKPTNILVNTVGDVKLCDFGVSGNLVASLAKTNIGCQSYMAPERIRGEPGVPAMAPPGFGNVPLPGTGFGVAPGTYGVQSDIWSLGLSILEIAKGVYPYPPETFNSVFAQLSAIVDGEPPELPEEFSQTAQGFVRQWYPPPPKSPFPPTIPPL